MIAFVLALSLAQDPLQEDAARLVRSLASETPQEYRRARRELADLGRRALPALLAELAKPEAAAQVRYLLCEVLGDVHDAADATLDALHGRLLDDDTGFGPSVASAAARALGKIGDPRSVDPLLAVLRDEARKADLDLRHETIVALGMLRTPAAVPDLRAALDETGQTALHQILAVAAAEALARIRSRDALPDLVKKLDARETQDAWRNASLAQMAAFAIECITGEHKGPLLDGEQPKREETLGLWREWRDSVWNADETRRKLDEVVQAIDRFRRERGMIPQALAELVPDFLPAAPADAWGQPFQYRLPGAGAEYDLFSHGKERFRGGDGPNQDLWNHDGWRAVEIERTYEAIGRAIDAIETHMAQNAGATPATLDPAIADAWGQNLVYEVRAGQDPAYMITSGGLGITAAPALTRRRIAEIAPKIDEHRATHEGQLPENLAALGALPNDGWGHPFEYEAPGTGAEYDLISRGVDTREGGTDEGSDVWNHDAWRAIYEQRTYDKMREAIAAVDTYRQAHENALPARIDEAGPELIDAWDYAFEIVPRAGQDPDYELVSRSADPPLSSLALVTRDRMAQIVERLAEIKQRTRSYPRQLPNDVPKDAWGNAFVYRLPGTGADYDLVSQGADGAQAGAGLDRDLWSHDAWIDVYSTRTRETVQRAVQAIEAYRRQNQKLPASLADLRGEFQDACGCALAYWMRPGQDPPYEVRALNQDRRYGGEGINADTSSLPVEAPPNEPTPPE